VRGFYDQNGYIEYSTAEKMLVNNPKGFLTKELGASGFALRTCYASLSLVQQVEALTSGSPVDVEAQVEEALASGSLVDVLPLLPPFMDGADAAEALEAAFMAAADAAEYNLCIYVCMYVSLRMCCIASGSLVDVLPLLLPFMDGADAAEILPAGILSGPAIHTAEYNGAS
ncbi:hypothetical protein T484DRAFT_1792132, partial [Baffinella frigidus]